MEKLESFEDACAIKNIDPSTQSDLSKVPEEFVKPLLAFYKLMVITSAKNKGWKADYKNPDQRKYYPLAWVKEDKSHPTGFGFAHTNYGCTRTDTNLGSRLAFQNADDTLEMLKRFEDLYKDLWLS